MKTLLHGATSAQKVHRLNFKRHQEPSSLVLCVYTPVTSLEFFKLNNLTDWIDFFILGSLHGEFEANVAFELH